MSQLKTKADKLSYYIYRQFCIISEDLPRHNEQSADFADAADFLLYFVLVLVRVIVIDSRTKTQRHKGEEAHAETLRRGEERER